MADSKPSWQREDEEEEDEIDEASYIMQKDAVLFAIDVSKSMLTPPKPSESKKADIDCPSLAAIKSAYQILQQRIISSPKDMMGVLLFGTEKSKFEDDAATKGVLAYPHCYLLSDLNIPSAEDVKALKSIVEGGDDARGLLEPSQEAVSMSNMLFCANQIFTTRAPNFGSRRLFIITDNDDPHANDKNARSGAAVRAKDLYDLGVVIELFPISHPDHDFDRARFYDDIIYRDPTGGNDAALAPSTFKIGSGDGISLLSNLISDINSKQVAKRTLFSNMPFEIGPGFKISVQGYNLLQRQAPARSCYVWLEGETAQIAVGETAKTEGDTNKEVTKVDIKKAYKFGGTQILFTPEELKELMDFGPPGIRIIGFKPQSMLPLWASVKKSSFIYPSENDYIGSTRVFAALWSKLLKDQKIGIAWYIARSNATPALVAILPSEERLDDLTSRQVFPAGLWLYQLPFADDIRHPPEVPKPLVAPDTLVDEMRKVVQQLQLPKAIYDPSKYPNPSLQWHYRILQAIALEEELPDTPEDKTMPKYRQIDKRAGEYIHNWGVILEEQARAYQKEIGSMDDDRKVKRERQDVAEDGPKKRIKVEKSSQTLDLVSADELKKIVNQGTLPKHTVAELKEWLSLKGLNSNGKKQDLMDRIERWAEEN